MPKFLRRNWSKASRLGKGRKKKQVWRSAKGRHSKMRNKRKGYPQIVEIGFKNEKTGRGLIEDKKPILVQNLAQLEKIGKGQTAILANVGAKKRIEIAKKAKEKGISISNLNVEKMIKKLNKKQAKSKEIDKKQENKK